MPVVELSSVAAPPSIVAVAAAGDPGSTRLVYAMVIGLIAVGIGLILLAVWILRQTRPDLSVLAPLERMGDGDWQKCDPSTQRRMLDDVRPDGAQPLESEPPPPPIDADFEQADHPVTSFSDLGPGLEGDVRDPTPPQIGSDPVADDQSRDETPPGTDVDPVDGVVPEGDAESSAHVDSAPDRQS